MAVQTDPFLDAFPEEPGDQLAWYADNLGISRDQIQRLMDLTAEDRKAAAALSWGEVSERWPDQAAYALGLLGETLERHSYDWPRVAAEITDANLPPAVAATLTGAADQAGQALRFIAQGRPPLSDWVVAFLKLTKTR